jgi:hypothetical protein
VFLGTEETIVPAGRWRTIDCSVLVAIKSD